MFLGFTFMLCLSVSAKSYASGDFGISDISTTPASSCEATNGVINIVIDMTDPGVSPYDISLDNGTSWLVNNQTPSGTGNLSVINQAWGSYNIAVRDATGAIVYPGIAQVLGCTYEMPAHSTSRFSIAEVSGASGYQWTMNIGSIVSGQNSRSATFDFSGESHLASGEICVQPTGPACTAPPTCFDLVVIATETTCNDGIDNDGDGDVDCDDATDCPIPDLFTIVTTNTTCGNDDGVVQINGAILNLEYEFSSFLNGVTTLIASGTITSQPYTFATSVGTGIYEIALRNSPSACPRVQHAFINASEDCIGSACSILGKNLVVNGEFDDGNTGFASDYTFAPYPTWGSGGQYGYYSVVPDNTMQNVYGLWAGVERNDPINGSFLAADPSGATGSNDDLWRQTVNVCPSQDYVFSAWAKNIFTLDYGEVEPDPNFSFYINGVLLPGASFTIPQQTTADAGVWIQVSGLWNSGTATTAELRITNNVSGTEGNDMAIDGIYLGLCGNTVNINPDKFSACYSEIVTLSADANTIAGSWNYFEWYRNGVSVASGSSMTVHNTSDMGVYELYAYTTSDNSGCPNISESISVAASATADVEIISCPENCTNGVDDDGDGLADCEDDDCPSVLPVSTISQN